MTRVLFLYSLTGGGHLRAAQTLARELQAIEPAFEIALRDGLTRGRLGFSMDPAQTYRRLSTDFLPLFDTLYRLLDRESGVPVLRALIRFIWGTELRAILDRERPDLVVSTHPFLSPATISPGHYRAPLVTVVTDLHGAPLVWFDRDARRIVLPVAELVQRARRHGQVSESRLAVLGYPLDPPRFRSRPAAPSEDRSMLLLGGGVGAGDLPRQALALRRELPEWRLVVVCGHNLGLRERLRALGDPLIEALGFVDDMHAQMLRAGVVITKPGPGTVAEAAALGKPMVVTRAVGLQERQNVTFVLDHGLGLHCPEPPGLAAAVEQAWRGRDAFHAAPQVFPGDARDVAAYLAGQARSASISSAVVAPIR